MDKRYVVCTQQHWGRETFELAVRLGERWDLLTALTGADVARAYDDLARMVPRYAFFLHWSSAVPVKRLAAVECVNFHCTWLPYGRGGSPIENLIRRGFRQTVMTAHRMTDEIDAGPIYRRAGDISLDGTRPEILARFVAPCAQLIRYIVDLEPAPIPQPVGETTLFKRLTPTEYAAFWATR